MSQVVLQVNSHVEKVRQFMHAHGFSVRSERITHDGFFYIALDVVYTGDIVHLSDEAAYLGTHLSVQNPLYAQYLTTEVQRITTILNQHPHAQEAKKRLQWITQRLNGQG
jgi:tRNA A22 N-methylase